jgi:carbamoyl-phosphate synthase large subunit
MSENSFKESTRLTNVLFVGGGRRNTLARMFAARGCNVFAYEISKDVPIVEEAVVIVGESFNSLRFVEDLQYTVDTCEIDLVIPLMDQAVPLCAKLERTAAICSPYNSSLKCLDKKVFERFMLEWFPEIYPEADNGVLIKKPRFGHGSTGVEIVNKRVDAESIYQSRKIGKEYTVDAYFDKNMNIVGACPRERTRVAGGEVVESRTVDMPLLERATSKVGRAIGLRGPVCMQYIIEPNGNFYLFEINARFGGGSTLSIEAGLDMIDMIKKEYIYGQELCASSYKIDHNMLMKRFFKDVYFKND